MMSDIGLNYLSRLDPSLSQISGQIPKDVSIKNNPQNKDLQSSSIQKSLLPFSNPMAN